MLVPAVSPLPYPIAVIHSYENCCIFNITLCHIFHGEISSMLFNVVP